MYQGRAGKTPNCERRALCSHGILLGRRVGGASRNPDASMEARLLAPDSASNSAPEVALLHRSVSGVRSVLRLIWLRPLNASMTLRDGWTFWFAIEFVFIVVGVSSVLEANAGR